MRLSKRDAIATGLVAVAGLSYLLWMIGSAPFSATSARGTGVVVLAFGFAASATAVVPTFARLLHGNKAYLAVTSLIGVVAAVAGVQVLVTTSGTALAVVMLAMITLWLIATTHHSRLTASAAPASRPRAGSIR
jgi:hypothetical protein